MTIIYSHTARKEHAKSIVMYSLVDDCQQRDATINQQATPTETRMMRTMHNSVEK